jgi:hypothetical protein
MRRRGVTLGIMPDLQGMSKTVYGPTGHPRKPAALGGMKKEI